MATHHIFLLIAMGLTLVILWGVLYAPVDRVGPRQ
jgi:hypothetical protein